MFTILLILILSAVGILLLPFAIALDILALPLLLTGGILALKKRKKNGRKLGTREEGDELIALSTKAANHMILWDEIHTPNQSLYQSHWKNWTIEIWEEENYRLMMVRNGNTPLMKVMYHPETQAFGQIVKDEKWLKKMKKTHSSKDIELAVTNLMHQITKENKLGIIKEEKSEEEMMQELNQWVKETKNLELIEEYQSFQNGYVEHIRYELHMNEKERKSWKETLKVLHQVSKQSHPIVFQQTVKKLNESIQKNHQLMRRKYSKNKANLPFTEEWDRMEWDIETWSTEEQNLYTHYKHHYLHLINSKKLDSLHNTVLKQGWNSLYECIDKPKERKESLQHQHQLIKKIKKERQKVNVYYRQ